MDSKQMVIESAKLALQLYFAGMRMAGKTAEQIDAMYNSQYQQFVQNDPDKLEDLSGAQSSGVGPSSQD